MKEHKEKLLFSTFPNLYRNKDLPDSVTRIQSFDIDDGWFDLIYSLSMELEKEIIQYIKDNPMIDPEEIPTAFQVKQKFGGLQFYMEGYTDKMRDLIAKAENASYKICEVCSIPGETRSDRHWIRTLCVNCHNKSKEKI